MGGNGDGTGDAVELLRGQGMRMTPQRLAIVGEIDVDLRLRHPDHW